MSRIAFLGLGAMGARMARHLVENADLVVYNRTPARAAELVEAGARLADTPRAAAEGADLVISMVTDDGAAEAIWLDPGSGALAGLRPGALALECSTVTPAWIHRLAQAVGGRGARLLDAPVAGTTPQAEAGKLLFMVGGTPSDVADATPVMERMGARIVHAGPQGHGAVLKLVVNALFATQVAAMAELLNLAEGQGLDPAGVVEMLATMPVTSPAAAGTGRLMIAERHAPMFPTDLVIKDLAYAGGLGVLPVADAARARFEAASAAGHGAANLTVVHAVTG